LALGDRHTGLLEVLLPPSGGRGKREEERAAAKKGGREGEREGGMTYPVVDDGELVRQLLGVVGRGLHGRHTGPQLRGHRLLEHAQDWEGGGEGGREGEVRVWKEMLQAGGYVVCVGVRQGKTARRDDLRDRPLQAGSREGGREGGLPCPLM